MSHQLTRLARVLVVPLILAVTSWPIALALNGQPLPNPLARLLPNGDSTFLRICNTCPGGLRPSSLVPGFEDRSIASLGPIDPQFVDASASDSVAFSRTVDRVTRSRSSVADWDSDRASSKTGSWSSLSGASLCRPTHPLVVVTRSGDGSLPDDVAQTYFTSSTWDRTTGSP
jgi:hypothetical protein